MDKPFRLASVLRHRQFIEEEHRRELARLVQLLEIDNAALSASLAERREWDRRLRERQRTGLNPAESLLHLRHLDRMDREIAQQATAVRKRQAAVDRQRTALLAAVKELRIMEKLEKKWKDAAASETERQERLFLDEIAISRYHRRRPEFRPPPRTAPLKGAS